MFNAIKSLLDPAQASPKGSGEQHGLGLGDQNNQPSGTTTPLSESYSFYSEPTRKRSSACSTAQHTPEEPPEVDLSHLSADEKAQIAAVIERAREMQEEENKRIRELEQDYTGYAARLSRRNSCNSLAGEDRSLCPICTEKELMVRADGTRIDQNICVDCQQYVCLSCGTFETSPSTQLKEWLCTMCQKRRKLVLGTGMWYYGHHAGQDLPDVKGLQEERSRQAESKGSEIDYNGKEGRYMRDAAKRGDLRESSQLNHSVSQNGADAMDAPRNPNEKTKSSGSKHVQETPRRKSNQVMSNRPDVVPMQDSVTHDRRGDVGVTSKQAGGAPGQRGAQHTSLHKVSSDRRGGGQEKETSCTESLDDSDRKVRPRSLSLTRQGSTSSYEGSTSDGSDTALSHSASSSEYQASSEQGGSSLQKSASRSSSVSSSPVKSPQWIHHPANVVSPSKSPEVGGAEYTGLVPATVDDDVYMFTDDVNIDYDSDTQMDIMSMLPDRPPPKPLRMHEIQKAEERYDILDTDTTEYGKTHTLDLASYAAAIANDTAQLTNLSVSPVNLPVAHPQDYLDVSPDQETVSPPSPNYYEEVEEVQVADPTPKTIDDQGTKRQKVRPPASDWSPVTDLSPIMDVSPSIELAEQAEMLAQQASVNLHLGGKHMVPPSSAAKSVVQPVQPVQPGPDDEPYTLHAMLKRYQNFEDISCIAGNTDSNGNGIQYSPGSVNGAVAGQAENVSSEIKKPQKKEVPPPVPKKPFLGSNVPGRKEIRQTESEETEQTSRDSTSRSKVAELRRTFEVTKAAPPPDPKPRQQRTLPPEPTHPPLPPKPPRERIELLRMGSSGSREGPPPAPVPAHTAESVDDRKSPKTRPQPLSIKTIEAETEGLENVSPHYRVLHSPVTPDRKMSGDHSYMETSPTISPDGSRAYIYPTPEPSPDRGASPPKPQSPSQLADSASPKSKTSPVPTDHIPVDVPPQVIKEVRKQAAPTGISKEPSETSKKVRRKLPPIPPGVEPVTAASKRQRSKSASPVGRIERPSHQTDYKSVGQDVREPEPQPQDRPTSAPTKRQVASQTSPTAPPPARVAATGNGKAAHSVSREMEKSAKQDITSADADRRNKKSVPETSTVRMYNVQVPSEIRSLKQRLKEELQITTATRRLELDGMEELRALERRLEEMKEKERYRQMQLQQTHQQIQQLQQQQQQQQQQQTRMTVSNMTSKQSTEISYTEEQESVTSQTVTSPDKGDGKRVEARRRATPPAATITSRTSPHTSPRRMRHKRQNSDPVISKFSPIEEARDFENDILGEMKADGLSEAKQGFEVNDTSLDTSSAFTPVRRLGNVTVPKVDASQQTDRSSEPTVSPTKSFNHYKPVADRKSYEPMGMPPLSKSTELLNRRSEVVPRLSMSQTELALSSVTRMKTPTSDDDERRRKEEKRQQLRVEIEKRKRQMEQEQRRQTGLPYSGPPPSTLTGNQLRHQPNGSPITSDKVPTGIIKPLDYCEMLELEQELQTDITRRGRPFPQTSYSSSEYLAHKVEHTGRLPLEGTGMIDSREYLVKDYQDGRVVSPRMHYGKSDASLLDGEEDVSGTSSQSQFAVAQSSRLDDKSDSTSKTPGSDVNSSSPPAMPILDDVTKRSRNLLRDIGSRPLSDEMDKYFQAEDPLTEMFRQDQQPEDRSIGDSDENIMEHLSEGGVTILEQVDRKKQKLPTPPRSYDFPTKRILLTRDPKDKSVKGHGVGLKIIGGKVVPGRGNELGAYVAAIYPGGIADQLHGELKVGDQVLEWNGVPLTGKTYEEVHQIVSQPNGEIELVVKPGAGLSTQPPASSTSLCTTSTSTTATTIHTSCHSSYDNLDLSSDLDDYVEQYLEEGVDPGVLAAHLEGISGRMSPGVSPTSSQQDMYLSPSMSSPGSSSPAPSSPPSEPSKKQLEAEKAPSTPVYRDLGDIQLQLSYDDFDGTLNVHVIAARNLVAKDKNGFSDPYVKVFLLPGRDADNKRHTKYIPKTLDPEWHQTLVFMNMSRRELARKTLEVTVWDYDRLKSNDFMGEVLLDLADDSHLDNKPHWHKLEERDDGHSARQSRSNTLSPPDSFSDSSHRSRRSRSSSRQRELSSGSGSRAPESGRSSSRQRDSGASGSHRESRTREVSASRRPRDVSTSSRHRDSSVGDAARDSPSSGRRPTSSSGGTRQREPSVSKIPQEQCRELSPPKPATPSKRSPRLVRKKDPKKQEHSKEASMKCKGTHTVSDDSLQNTSQMSNSSAQNILKFDMVSMETSKRRLESKLHNATSERNPAEHCHRSDLMSPSQSFSGQSSDSDGSTGISSCGRRRVDYTSTKISAIHKDIMSRSDVNPTLGPGQTLNVGLTRKVKRDTDVKPRSAGSLMLGIQRNSEANSLVISVMNCKMKEQNVHDRLLDWFVKVSLLRGGDRQFSRIKKRKTCVQQANTTPCFNETFIFNGNCAGIYLQLLVCIDKGRFGQKKLVGTVTVNLDAVPFDDYLNNEVIESYNIEPT